MFVASISKMSIEPHSGRPEVVPYTPGRAAPMELSHVCNSELQTDRTYGAGKYVMSVWIDIEADTIRSLL